MKKILILLVATILLSSCFGKNDVETPEDIVSNIVEVEATVDTETSENTVEITSEETEAPVEAEEVKMEIDENPVDVVSGSDNDPRVTNTQGEGTNPPETQTPSVPTETASNPEEQEIIKDFEQELDSLFDLIESDEG